MLKKIILLTAAAALCTAGFVGAGLASTVGGAECVPGTLGCKTTTTTTTTKKKKSGSGSATTTGTTTGATTRATTTQADPKDLTPTLELSAKVVDVGSVVHLTGKVPVASAGQIVEIVTQTCGFTQALRTATAKTRSNGAYSLALQPMRNATFAARYGGMTSDSRALRVRPRVDLRLGSGGFFAVDVSAGAGSFFSKRVVLERYDKARRHWHALAAANLRASSDVAAIIAVSSAKIRAAVRHGAKVRASVGAATVGKCYLPATSRSITR